MRKRCYIIKLIAIGATVGWAMHVGQPSVRSADLPETLRTLPYSAEVVRAMEQARQGLAAGAGESALESLHALLAKHSPALTAERLLLHREVARAFIELGFQDHALRTLSVALQDAEAANLHEQALAIQEELDAAYATFRRGTPEQAPVEAAERQRASHVQPAGLLDRLLGRRQHHHSHAQPTVAPVPGAPHGTSAPVVAPTTPAVPHTHQHNHGSFLWPRPAWNSAGLWQRFKHFFHRFRPQPVAQPGPPRMAPSRPTMPGLPQYPRADCETCRKRRPYPSIATPPVPTPPGPGVPYGGGYQQPAPAMPAVPTSPYSTLPAVPGHVHQGQPGGLQPIAPRPSWWQRIRQSVRASLQRLTRPPVSSPAPPMISPQWPDEAMQMGRTLQGEPVR